MPTRVLIVGGGAREHALAWKLASEPGVNEIVVAPGKEAIVQLPRVAGALENPVSPEAMVATARRHAVELVVIGPEAPLAAGVADALIEAGIAVFGPTRGAARIETSKAYCREVAQAAGVPMAEGRAYGPDERETARADATRLAERGGVVVKADGLAAGKGVTVCEDAVAAEAALAATDGTVVVEERLVGREASVIALTDGRHAMALPISRDHKRLLDGDEGPNTGGMGAYSPLPDLDDADADAVIERFHLPILRELASRGMPFRGALYAGLMLTSDGPRLLECNARFGDPETQVTVPRLAEPLGPWLLAAATGRLRETRRFGTMPGAAVGIVLAADGYPGDARLGEAIEGLDAAGQIHGVPDALVFHGHTFREAPSRYLANGGRVLTVVGRGRDLAAARAAAESAADKISWPGMQRRHDIGLPPTAVAVGAAR
jgi:phosphoribosylamine--glycine ligase